MTKPETFSPGWRQRIAAEAAKLIDVGIRDHMPLREDPGNRNTGDALRELWQEAGFPKKYGASWCGAFVVAAYRRAGISAPHSYFSALLDASRAPNYAREHNLPSLDLTAPEYRRDAAARNRLLATPSVIQTGDVVVFPSRGHLGLVVEYDPQTGKLTTAEGNTWGADNVHRALFKTYYLRSDVELPKRTQDLFSKGQAPYFIRYQPSEKPGEVPAETHEQKQPVREVRPKTSMESPRQAETSTPTETRKDAGVIRPGGIQPPLSSLGHFQAARTIADAVNVLQKEGRVGADPSSAILSQGTLDDINKEVQRLETLRNEFSNWQSYSPELAKDLEIHRAGKTLDDTIGRLTTYAKERQPHQDIKGDSHVKVLFDGSRLYIRDKNWARAGDTIMESVVSGRDRYISTRDTSKLAQQKIGRGPIPEGTYWINFKEISYLSIIEDRPSWGEARLTIHPFPTTETFGRGGFFIHSGDTPGTRGCIDIWGRERETGKDRAKVFFGTLQQAVGDMSYRVVVVVDYSPGKERWAQAQLTPAEREKVAAKMEQALRLNDHLGYDAARHQALERSFGMQVTDAAKQGKFSEAAVWHIAAWQKSLVLDGINTGGIDGIVGDKTKPWLDARLSQEAARTEPRSELPPKREAGSKQEFVGPRGSVDSSETKEPSKEVGQKSRILHQGEHEFR